MRFIEREPVRFVLAGGVNALVTYGVYLILLPLIGYTVAYSVQFVGGIFFAYYLNARFVFRRPLRWRHAMQYPLVYLLQYGLGLALMTVLVEWLHLHAELAPVLVIVAMLPFTFWLARWIIKRENRGPTAKRTTSAGDNLNSLGF
ncbi:GtrA family protein [Mycobacterium intracellulare]|uniref:GtrA family protein n=1 Tax=Mycobacterium intracellulare TaxID=1767 RepID=UPI000BAAFFD4|nr:GtrA family protein [Mycobacterium intracellulare]ASW86162.1 polysaccharide synthesis protein GtrA [Mycobacterium intracellulare]